MNVAVVLGAGDGTRFDKNKSKIFALLNDQPVIYYSLKAFNDNSKIDYIVAVTKDSEIKNITDIANKNNFTKVRYVISGGNNRQESVFRALTFLKDKLKDDDKIIIHDAARPLLSEEIINNSIDALKTYHAATVAIKVRDTLAKSYNSTSLEETIDRNNLYQVQTPQSFVFGYIYEAHQYFKNKPCATDDASLLQKFGVKIKIVPGTIKLMKLTTKEDLEILNRIMDK